jgi:hypothetical protein
MSVKRLAATSRRELDRCTYPTCVKVSAVGTATHSTPNGIIPSHPEYRLEGVILGVAEPSPTRAMDNIENPCPVRAADFTTKRGSATPLPVRATAIAAMVPFESKQKAWNRIGLPPGIPFGR